MERAILSLMDIVNNTIMIQDFGEGLFESVEDSVIDEYYHVGEAECGEATGYAGRTDLKRRK